MTLANLDWTQIVDRLASLASSTIAQESLRKLKPFSRAEDAEQSFQEIVASAEVIHKNLRSRMESLDLYLVWQPRLSKRAVLKTIELRDVRTFCSDHQWLRDSLQSCENEFLRQQFDASPDLAPALSFIDQIISPDGEIRSDASEKLFQLFREKERLQKEIQSQLDRMVKDFQMEHYLQDKFVTTREGRWVVPVKSGLQHHVPGVIHGSSHTKQTVYMEPERIIPTNNRLRQVEVEIEDEIERLLTELSHYLHDQMSLLTAAQGFLLRFDVLFAKAQLAIQIQGQIPQFSQNKLVLQDLAHPLLLLSDRDVVRNTVELDDTHSLLLLSGPNAGGKTVLMKSIGLAAQMARCGLPICADSQSLIPFFKNIAVSVGDAQSVTSELSTFAGHMRILSECAQLQGHETLVLIDEICGSTDPEEGSALARAFIEKFARNSVFGIITSHLGPLKSGWAKGSKVISGSLEYDSATGLPTYRFISGIPGESLAIQTAKRVGVQTEIIERALDVMSPVTRARLQKFEEIEDLKKQITETQDLLRKELRRVQDAKSKYEREWNQLQKDREQILRKTAVKAEKKVDEAIAQTKAAQAFQRHRALEEIKFQLPEIIKAKPTVQDSAPKTADEFFQRYPQGSKVHVMTLNQDGIVQSAPNGKGEIMILSQSMRMLVDWKQLRPPHTPDSKSSPRSQGLSSRGIADYDLERSLDLRGKTVQEAVETLEIALDKAVHQGQERLKIIHGFGTEALKKAVRAYLSRSTYVTTWKSGTPETGGDGVTWADLANQNEV